MAESLLDSIWCEGAAFVDHDASRLLFFGGPTEITEFAWRNRALVALVRAMIPAREPKGPVWTVEHAHEGIASIAEAAGIPRASVVADRTTSSSRSSFDYRRTLEELAVAPPGAHVLSVRGLDGGVRDLSFSSLRSGWASIAELLVHGEACLPWIAARAPLPEPPSEERVTSGAFVDLRAHTLSAWHCRDVGTLRAILEQAWPGWSVRVHGGGLPEQVRESGRDAGKFAVPTERAVSEMLQIMMNEVCFAHDVEQGYVRLFEQLYMAGYADEDPLEMTLFNSNGPRRTPDDWRAAANELATRAVNGEAPRHRHFMLA